MKYALLLPLLFILPACGSFSNVVEAIRDGREIVRDLRETYEDLKPVVEEIVGDVKDAAELYENIKDEMSSIKDDLKELDAEAFAQADKDGDGELDWLERIAYYLLIGGGSLEIGRRKLKALREAAANNGAAPAA